MVLACYGHRRASLKEWWQMRVPPLHQNRELSLSWKSVVAQCHLQLVCGSIVNKQLMSALVVCHAFCPPFSPPTSQWILQWVLWGRLSSVGGTDADWTGKLWKGHIVEKSGMLWRLCEGSVDTFTSRVACSDCPVCRGLHCTEKACDLVWCIGLCHCSCLEENHSVCIKELRSENWVIIIPDSVLVE